MKKNLLIVNTVISFIKSNKEILARFLLSGGVAAGVNVVVLYVLTDWLGWWYLVSAVFSFCAAVMSGFFLQKWWTFRHRLGGRAQVQFAIYVVWTTTSFFLNLLILYLLVDLAGVYYLLGQIFSSAILAGGSLFIYSRLVFTV